MENNNKAGKAYSIIGKIVVGIIIVILAMPWISDIIHIQFKGPAGNTYVYTAKSENGLYTDYTVISFLENNKMNVYRYQEDVFAKVYGFMFNYIYGGNSRFHIGPVFLSLHPSILFWNNYSIENQYTKDIAEVTAYISEIRSKNLNEMGKTDLEAGYPMDITIREKSILIDGIQFDLWESETLPYGASSIEEDSKLEWRRESK